MQNESVGNRSFRDMFSQNVSFEIPFFQRGYAWEKRQWDGLFQDIEEQILNESIDVEDVKNFELFFGSIVVAETEESSVEFRKYTVIDGQQRITTVYLLLSLIHNIFKKKISQSNDARLHADDLTFLIENRNINRGEYRKMKIYSSKGDRLPTYKTIFGENPKDILHSDIELYNKGDNNIDKLKEYCDKKFRDEKYSNVPSLWKLCIALLDSIKVVWIPLKKSDDQQAIFESLNDKGMPLSAAELLCNFIFKPIIIAKQDYEKLHNEKWLFTQRHIEGGTKGFEQYLRCLFSIGTKKLVGQGRPLYAYFKNTNKDITTEQSIKIIDDIATCSDDFNFIVKPLEHNISVNELRPIMESIISTRMEGAYTFLLSILKSFRENDLTQSDVISLFRETMILMVRRKYGEMRVTKYDTIFPGLLKRLIGERNKINRFQQIIRAEDYWVSDDEFADYIIERPLYRTKDLPFTNMILQEVDKKLETYGQYPDYTTLNTVEHILPQTLNKEWKEYIGNEACNEDLKRYTDTIGNLTLLSQPANSHAGQDPFVSKISDYTQVSALNRDILERRDKIWNIAAIKERSIFLRSLLLEVFAWSK